MPVDRHPGRMNTMLATQDSATAGADFWALMEAVRLLDEAAEQVGASAVNAGDTADAAQWQNSGMRSLRWGLSDLNAELASQRGELLFLRDQVARAVSS